MTNKEKGKLNINKPEKNMKIRQIISKNKERK